MKATFHVPPAFAALSKAGRFDYWGAPHSSLTEEKRKKLLAQRKLEVLWWSSIEWDRTLAEVLEFDGGELLRPGLIPFAGDGCGNKFCWFPKWQDGPEPPIVFATADESERGLFARNFSECLCRCLLRHYAAWDATEGDPGAMRIQWDANVAILREWLEPELRKVLTAVGKKLSPETCAEADAALAASIGERKLVCMLLPTSYDEEFLTNRKELLAAYDESIDFYRELVEEERAELRAELELARANRKRVAARKR